MPKVVLVTGCTKGGIGHALCEEFAERGCKVYGSARRLDSMEFSHGGIVSLKVDVTKDEDIQAAVDTIIEKEGRLDVVVNNAGAMASGPVVDADMDKLIDTFHTNTFSAIRMVQKVFPHMASRKSGLIVNIGSVMGETPTPWSGVYSATKAALGLFTDTLYMECAPFGINVMLIVPGSVQSNISNNMLSWFHLPEGSLYTPWTGSIIARINASQGSDAMSGEAFAKQVAGASLSKTPPRYLTLGGKSGLFSLMKWLPRGWVLQWLWRRFGGKDKPKSE